MRTKPLKALLAFVIAGTSSSICLGQDWESPPVGTFAITTGQGGAMILPRYATSNRSYALTGERTELSQSSRQWQRQLGPVYRAGQMQIILPATR